MSWITIIWSCMAGVCVGLAGLQVLTWMKSRDSLPYLLFSIAALGGAGAALVELAMMRAQSTAQFGELLRVYHVPIFILVVALVWFVRSYLKAGRLWLAWLITGLRILVLILAFSMEPNLNFTEITGLHSIPFMGEIVVVPIGEKNPWQNITFASAILFIIFVLDATVSTWRAGNRGRARVVGVTICIALIVAIALAEFFARGMLPVPYSLSIPFLMILAAFAYELSADLVRVNRLARELLNAEQRLELATKGAEVGVWDWDIEHDQTWVSDTIRRRLGLADDGGLDFDRILQSIHPDDREAVQQIVRNALGNQEDIDLEYRARTANDEIKWTKVRGYVERNPAGNPLHMRGVSMDITAKKQAEMEAAELRDELAHAQRVSTLGHLSSALAHEINQPLGAILRNTEAAELFLRQDPPDLEELHDIVLDIRRDEQRASSVIERMRSLLKRRELQYEMLAVDELIDQITKLLQTEIQFHNLSVQVDLAHELPTVRGDRVHLQQVILNLVMNSVDACDENPNGNHQIVIRASRTQEGKIELAVSDNGPGIAPEVFPRLFEPFVTTKAKGTGLGLAISKNIVEMHGGHLWAENNPQGGATFRFTLPIAGQGDE